MPARKALIDAGVNPADMTMLFNVLEQFSWTSETVEERAYRAALMLRMFLPNEADVERLAPLVAAQKHWAH